MRAVIAIVIATLILGPRHGPVLAQTRSGDFPALESVRMNDALTGWAMTAQPGASALLRTTDGGTHWKDVTPLTPSGQRIAVDHIAVLTSLSAWVSRTRGAPADTAQVFRTVDGGQTWKNVTIPALDVISIHFINVRDGWLLSEEEAHMGREAVDIYRSIDNGETWTKIAGTSHEDESSGLPYDGDKAGITFLNATTGWVTGTVLGPDWLYLYVTHNGGRTWQQQNLPLPSQLTPHWRAFTQPPTFFSARDGVLPVLYSVKNESYEDVSGGVVFYITRDGGTTWAYTTPVSIKLGNRLSFSFADANHGWMTDRGALYATSDGGREWTTIRPIPSLAYVKQLDFISPQVGWALRQTSPFLLKTLDGGRTWAPVAYTISRP